jgi:hypothetical protein
LPIPYSDLGDEAIATWATRLAIQVRAAELFSPSTSKCGDEYGMQVLYCGLFYTVLGDRPTRFGNLLIFSENNIKKIKIPQNSPFLKQIQNGNFTWT